jgi:hypothetical protein
MGGQALSATACAPDTHSKSLITLVAPEDCILNVDTVAPLEFRLAQRLDGGVRSKSNHVVLRREWKRAPVILGLAESSDMMDGSGLAGYDARLSRHPREVVPIHHSTAPRSAAASLDSYPQHWLFLLTTRLSPR